MMSIRRLAITLVVGGSLLLGSGLYLPAKAALAQVLMRQAWSETEFDPVRPWPWAETWPVARLRVPAHGVDQVVLAGDEGAALAFAPGHVDGTAPPVNPATRSLPAIATRSSPFSAGSGSVMKSNSSPRPASAGATPSPAPTSWMSTTLGSSTPPPNPP